VRDLVIRSTDGKTSVVVSLPCGRVQQCWPASPVWTPDSHKVSFALRTPGSHARSIYTVNADGTSLALALASTAPIDALRYGPGGELAMLATVGATKELGAVEAGAPIVGDLNAAPPEQRIAVLEQRKAALVFSTDLFVYEYDWRPDGRGFVGTAAPGDGDNNWWVAKLYAFDRSSGEARILYAPTSPRQQLAAPTVSRDGKHVAFILGIMSDFGSTGGDVYTMSLAGGPATNLTPKLPASVTSIHWGCDGHLMAVAIAAESERARRLWQH